MSRGTHGTGLGNYPNWFRNGSGSGKLPESPTEAFRDELVQASYLNLHVIYLNLFKTVDTHLRRTIHPVSSTLLLPIRA